MAQPEVPTLHLGCPAFGPPSEIVLSVCGRSVSPFRRGRNTPQSGRLDLLTNTWRCVLAGLPHTTDYNRTDTAMGQKLQSFPNLKLSVATSSRLERTSGTYCNAL